VLGITPNPYQRAAAGCVLLAMLVRLIGAATASLPVLAVGFVFAMIAVAKRHQYPDSISDTPARHGVGSGDPPTTG
jgi:hypothetical protein